MFRVLLENMIFNEIEIIDDSKNGIQFIEEIIKRKNQEDAFYVLDIGDVVNKHRIWRSKLPRIEPHFAIKCNPDPSVIKILASLDASFDCSSKHEIEQALSNGVSSDHIIFANTVKPKSHIEFARKVGVNKLTVDSEFELDKIKNLFPEAKILIRFRCHSSKAETTFGLKCGCDYVNEAPKLIRKIKELKLCLHGFSFHVGTNCSEPTAWNEGLKTASNLIKYAESLGIENVKMIDIGGGFPGEKDPRLFDKYAKAINEVLDEIDPTIKVISEPGRYYVASAFTLATLVYGKKIVNEGSDNARYMYYINDGTYGSFVEVMLNLRTPIPDQLNKSKTNEKSYPSTFWGPTFDRYDCVVKDCNFPELNINDWIVWKNMGAYTVSLAGNFNGISPPVIFPFVTQKDWKSFSEERRIHVIEKNGTIAWKSK